MFLQFYKPTAELTPHVQTIMAFRDQTLADTPILKPFPPAAEQTLYFYPGNPLRNNSIIQNKEAKIPFSTIVGPHTTRVNLSIQGDHLVIAVFFRPGGLQRLQRHGGRGHTGKEAFLRILHVGMVFSIRFVNFAP